MEKRYVGDDTYFEVPYRIMRQAAQLMAVEMSCSEIVDRDPVTGLPKPFLFTELVYFWDAAGREIGYWNRPCQVFNVLAPNYRNWHPDALAIEVFKKIPPEVVKEWAGTRDG